jgi:hypothetical protein
MSANLTMTIVVLGLAAALLVIGSWPLAVAIGCGCATFSMLYYRQ